MPRHRFTWEAFFDETVDGLAKALGYEPGDGGQSPREFLDGLLKRPTLSFVGEYKGAVLQHWVAKHEPTARYLYQRLANAGIGPDYKRPRSLGGYLKYLDETQNRKTFREVVAETMVAFGDADADSTERVTPGLVPSFGIVPIERVEPDERRPHDYQEAAWEKLGSHLAHADTGEDFQGLLVMPTGAGKTFTAVRWLMTHVIARGLRVLWLAHRQELLVHAAAEFHRTAALAEPRERLRIRIVSGGHCSTSAIHPEDDVVVASIASLARRPDVREELASDPRLFVVVDEAHHSPATSYRLLLDELRKNKQFRLLGLTATPTRTVERERPELARLFGKNIIDQVELRTLIERGTLSRPRLVRVNTGADASAGVTDHDLDHLSRFHDLSEDWLQRIADISERNRVIIEHYLEKRETYGRTLMFAINVNHAALLASELKERGVRADYVASRRPDGTPGEPMAIIQKFREGELDVLVNVQMVTEGVDVPGIQAVFLARPTNSEILLRQMLGRALRGPGAGGTEYAYLVSFEDHWGRFSDWDSPFDLVPDIQAEDDSGDEPGEDDTPKEPTVRPELIEALPWDLVRTTARELRRLRPSAPVLAFEAVPHGWYVFEHEGEEDHQSIRHVVPYYEHQRPCWEHALSALWSMSKSAAAKLTPADLDDSFGDSDDPRPAERDIEEAIRLRAIGGDRPEPIPFEEREKSEPRALARKIWDDDMGPRGRAELVEAAYSGLPRAVYPSLQEYQSAVDAAVYAIQNPADAQVLPKAVPLFELGDNQLLTPGPHHDLDSLFAEMRADAAPLLEIATLPHEGEVVWTKRIVKGWYGKAHYTAGSPAGHGQIRINRMLDSPDVPDHVLRWLLWHEYLHLYLQSAHTETFRDLERRWPGFREAELFLDTLNERFGVQAW